MPIKAIRSFLSHLPLMETITEIMHGLLIFAALVILPAIFAPAETVEIMIWYFLAYIIAYALRLYSSVIWPIFVSSVLIISLPFLPFWDYSISAQILLPLGLAFITMRAFVMRLTEANGQPGSLLMSQIPAIAYLLALTALATHFELARVTTVYFYLAIVYMLLALYRWHALNLTIHLHRFDTMPSQPAYRIRRFNQFLLIGFAAFMFLFLLISPLLGLHRLVPLMGSGLLALLQWLVGLLQRQEGNGTTAPQAPPESPVETTHPDQFIPLPEPSEPAPWVAVIQDIMYYAVLTIGIAIMAFIFGYLLYLAYKRFYAMQKGPDETESLVPKVGEDIKESLERKKTRFRQQFGRSPQQKIRRFYWKTVAQLIEAGMPAPRKQSPRRFAQAVKAETDIDLGAMVSLYEKARYGHGSCSDADVQRMHEQYTAFRRIRRQGIKLKSKQKTSGLFGRREE